MALFFIFEKGVWLPNFGCIFLKQVDVVDLLTSRGITKFQPLISPLLAKGQLNSPLVGRVVQRFNVPHQNVHSNNHRVV